MGIRLRRRSFELLVAWSLVLAGQRALAQCGPCANPSFDSAGHAFLAGGSPQAIAVADLNGDGIPDVVVVNASTNNISVFLGSGTGMLSAATNYAVGQTPVAVAIGAFPERRKVAMSQRESDR